MSPPAGVYIIRPKDAPGNALLIGPAIQLPFPLPDIPVKIGNKFVTRWLLRNAANNTFNVFAGKGNPNDFKWINEDNSLIASPTKKPDDFRFESAGNGFWVIGIPNKDLLLTLGDEDKLTFEPANGSSAQRFELIHIQPRD